MSRSPEKITRIDLWLAGTMRPNSDVKRRLTASSISVEDTARVVQECRAAGLYQIEKVTEQALVDFFGPPTMHSVDRLNYELNLWPEHHYEWYFDPGGRIDHSTFIRRSRDALLGRSVPSEAVAAVFRPWYHTEADVRQILGSPQSEQGWWPEHSFAYPLPGGKQLIFTFEHGLLVSVSVEFPNSRASI